MLITDIIEINKTKSKVYIDYELAFALYKSELRKYGIKKNSELTGGAYDEIVNEVLVKRAKLRLMNLMQSRDYTEYQLKDKLAKGYYPKPVIEAALDYVRAYGYVDDIRYSQNFIKSSSGKKSKKQIETDLLKKGVSKENIFLAFESFNEADEEYREEDIIKKLLLKKHYTDKNATVKERQKMIGYLYRKGFSLDKIYKVVEEIN